MFHPNDCRSIVNTHALFGPHSATVRRQQRDSRSHKCSLVREVPVEKRRKKKCKKKHKTGGMIQCPFPVDLFLAPRPLDPFHPSINTKLSKLSQRWHTADRPLAAANKHWVAPRACRRDFQLQLNSAERLRLIRERKKQLNRKLGHRPRRPGSGGQNRRLGRAARTAKEGTRRFLPSGTAAAPICSTTSGWRKPSPRTKARAQAVDGTAGLIPSPPTANPNARGEK